jgi:C_GCAxxG_C_C family probable redox protein
MNKVEIATSLFKKGYNCSQALLVSYGIELGLNRKTAMKIASAFGGGIGRMGETCGAVTGAIMIIGLIYGKSRLDKNAKAKTYELTRKFVKKFKARNNSIICRELIGIDISSNSELNSNVNEIIKVKCPAYVQNAAEIIEEII